MRSEPTEIYTAASMQQAHMLKNALAEVGIQAVVTNDALEKGSGVDMVGWATLPRVLVPEEDAPLARQIALAYDRRGMVASAPPPATEAESSSALAEPWPRCPQCGARRVTRCEICHTSGDHFPLADPEYVWGMGLDEAPEATSCRCGAACCPPVRKSDADEGHSEDNVPAPEDDEGPEPLVLCCPTCDEPFLPRFACRCLACGHEFPDGYDPEGGPADLPEQSDSRVLLLLAGTVLVVVILVVWYASIL